MTLQRKTPDRSAHPPYYGIGIIGAVLAAGLADNACSHLGLSMEIQMPSVHEQGYTPKFQGTLPDGRVISSYLLLTPGASVLSEDARPLNCAEDFGACYILNPLHLWWRSEDMIEVRPTVLDPRSGMPQSNKFRWSERECVTIARGSMIRIGSFHEPKPAKFVGFSSEGGCILRLP